MELVVPPLAEGTHTLLDMNCTGIDASTQGALEIPMQVEILCTVDEGRTSQVNDEVEQKVELMKIAEAREEAMHLADTGDNESAIQMLSKKIEDLDTNLYCQIFSNEIEE